MNCGHRERSHGNAHRSSFLRTMAVVLRTTGDRFGSCFPQDSPKLESLQQFRNVELRRWERVELCSLGGEMNLARSASLCLGLDRGVRRCGAALTEIASGTARCANPRLRFRVAIGQSNLGVLAGTPWSAPCRGRWWFRRECV